MMLTRYDIFCAYDEYGDGQHVEWESLEYGDWMRADDVICKIKELEDENQRLKDEIESLKQPDWWYKDETR